MKKEIILLGSTGSIGTQTLDVCKKHKIGVNVLVAHSNYKLLANQINEFQPKYAVLVNEEHKEIFIGLVKTKKTKLFFGSENILEAIKISNGLVVNSIVGIAGLLPTITAIENKMDIALANKETLVCAGDFVMKKAKEYNVRILPVDSEHSAILQSIHGYKNKDINKIFLTASGGPFFGKSKKGLKSVTLEDTLKHPNWDMGSKITVDCATLMNKGLEAIEAVHFFNIDIDDIEIVIHRESVIHSAVEFKDGSVIAQMGVPDMRIPIQYAITYPNRLESDAKKLTLYDYKNLSFYKPDFDTFTALKTCIESIKLGGLLPCIVNSANEEAVKMFLNKEISFLEISNIVEKARTYFIDLSKHKHYSIEDVLETDRISRDFARKNASLD